MKYDLLPKTNPCLSQPQICIIDPALALSVHGVPLIQQLGEVMELWVVRELWHILDSSSFYSQHPELITPKGINSCRTPKQERVALEETLCSLKRWEQFRMENDLARLNLFWLGDSLRESLLPKNKNLEIFWQWEVLTKSLDSQLDESQTIDYVLPLAFRDTIALAASLGSAFILTYQQKADFEKNFPPEICKALQFWGISCQVLTPRDSCVSVERDYLRQLLVSTGTIKFLWAGLHLIVLHLFVPESPKANVLSQKLPFSPSDLADEKVDSPKLQNEPWIGARGFWYLV
ncbi:hypothetical protein [Nostoc sp. LEGE 12450]|uniref:hypothetical protein n=1 Tax=Nostoc sp. LEGE 12450 TaxID=1828643 RepID=UPI00187EC9DD|nr:hypothetical protein [Nostoc sp. LEGE 12450]MBE8991616.1 hypothetical protein [Nostoc sp. LEGE 12450]